MPFRIQSSKRVIGLLSASVSLAFLAGLGFDMLRIPLAWVLGPLIATAALSLSGLPVFRSNVARRAGQIAIGGGLGLHVTAALLTEMLAWVPFMIVLSLVAISVTSFFSVFLGRFSGLDRVTSYFALLPGGLSEMANIGAKVGATSEPIALSQAIRVAFVVCVLPPAIVALGIHGTFEAYDGAVEAVSYRTLPLLFAASLIGVWVMSLIGANNPWMLGAIVTAALLSSNELVVGAMPRPVFYGGQLLLGMAIGARFRQEIVMRLPRLSLMMTLFTLFVTVSLFGLGMIVALLSALDPATAALATSAGGVAEMALTAQFLNLNVALILAFHVIRAIVVNGVSVTLFNLFTRTGFFGAVERLEAFLFGARRR
ncbi:AbrB family transcriptional regulator [Alkalilacustris brevis]|uniref:AbrB family transcriptional regulator n=1 Tax=Alkalilacustris brevis TaxID=2026338 RepID=UPI002367CA7C|nr:AbrB family transcriptional regulator [Alkalilacustris brevis]